MPQKDGSPTSAERLAKLESNMERVLNHYYSGEHHRNRSEISRLDQRCDGLAEQASNREDRMKREMHRVEQLLEVRGQQLRALEGRIDAKLRTEVDDGGDGAQIVRASEWGDGHVCYDAREVERDSRTGLWVFAIILAVGLAGITIGMAFNLWSAYISLPTCLLT